MPNTRVGHDDLILYLTQQKAPVRVVLEPTADFIGPWPIGWHRRGYRCTSPHPWQGLGFERHCIPPGTSTTARMRVS